MPALYRAVTRVSVNGCPADRYETEFGFRWIAWTADCGFYLNGNHRYFKGANVHQDQRAGAMRSWQSGISIVLRPA
jgi:beta-galactosidase